MVNVVIYNLKV